MSVRICECVVLILFLFEFIKIMQWVGVICLHVGWVRGGGLGVARKGKISLKKYINNPYIVGVGLLK